MRLAKALKQAYGPRADRGPDLGQPLLGFGKHLGALPISSDDLPSDADEDTASRTDRPPGSRRLRTRGRRDIGALDHLPLIEQTYELTDDLCRCPTCQHAGEDRHGGQLHDRVPAGLVRAGQARPAQVCLPGLRAEWAQPEHHAGRQDGRLADRQGAAGRVEENAGASPRGAPTSAFLTRRVLPRTRLTPHRRPIHAAGRRCQPKTRGAVRSADAQLSGRRMKNWGSSIRQRPVTDGDPPARRSRSAAGCCAR